MAFGINRQQLTEWKEQVRRGEIAYLTHYWYDERFPEVKTVTKVGCSDLDKLTAWCHRHRLDPKYIHRREHYPHFDLIGPRQREILVEEQLWDHIHRFQM